FAALVGGCGAFGLICAVAGIRGKSGEMADRPPARWRGWLRAAIDPSRRRRLLAALAAGLVVLLVVGWPVAALAASVAAYVLPRMLSGREAAQRIVRLEAQEQWARRLGEVIGASRGLEQALTD